MSLHADLLAQADSLARLETGRPKQASLRRAISAAYYALFHLLVREAAGLFTGDRVVRSHLSRMYTHTALRGVAESFRDEKLPGKHQTPVKIFVPPELKSVADAFVQLQKARHDADYDLAKTFTRMEALEMVDLARQAFQSWKTVRKHESTRLMLGCFASR
jgi:uncharacterized protein (UPF0332 family)